MSAVDLYAMGREGDTKEWARNGSFMKKPASGWLHDDAALSHGDGVYYPVKVRLRRIVHATPLSLP